MIAGSWGEDYLSTRVVKRAAGSMNATGNATFAEDMEAEGGDTRLIWIFRRLDEQRMLSLWGGLRGNAADNAHQQNPSETSFRTSDMVICAGRGYELDGDPAASFTDRAKGSLVLAGVASSGGALASRAEHYIKVEHW